MVARINNEEFDDIPKRIPFNGFVIQYDGEKYSIPVPFPGSRLIQAYVTIQEDSLREGRMVCTEYNTLAGRRETFKDENFTKQDRYWVDKQGNPIKNSELSKRFDILHKFLKEKFLEEVISS
ncbi:MAG: hypothetical protein PHF86_11410 [Candidatus Nanoarchaeia archaeon]|nr:hypothetical protein [Candidatus Nanoarchaeia archaeon]